MEILPVNDLDVALHNFVNKDDKLAFFSCVQYNLQETRSKIAKDADNVKFEEEDLILKVGECFEERVKERPLRAKDNPQFTSSSLSLGGTRSESAAGIGSAASFSDDEDTTQITGVKSASRGRKGSSVGASSHQDASGPTRGRGRGRGRGSGTLKQTTIDAALGFRQSQRAASINASVAVQSIADDEENVDSASSEEAEKYAINEVHDSSEDDGSLIGKGRKRAAPRGRGRASTSSSKRGRKSDNSSFHRMLINKEDDDDDEDDDVGKKLNKSQPRVTRNYGALRR